MSNKILVVGGAGYIGSHVILDLLDANKFDILVFDNLSRGHADSCSQVPLVKGDLRNISDISDALKLFQPTLVMHFAALAYVGESMQEPEMYYENNIIGTLNLLRSMHQWETKKIVFSSTCTVYGEPKRLPILESDATNPINPYGISKLFSEYAMRDYCSAYGFSAIALRYFNAAGADSNGLAWERHNPETHLIPLVLEEAMRTKLGGEPKLTNLKIFGFDYPTEDGTCIRDYVHVSDISKAHLLSAEKILKSRDGYFEAYNLGSGVGYSVSQVIEIARKVTQQPIYFSAYSRRLGDPAMLVASSELAREKLGWEPSYQNLEIIIRSAWDAFENNNFSNAISKFS